MIMRIKSSLFISLCLILLTMSITAQDKQLSLHDLIPGGKTYSRFVPRDLKQLRWCGDEYLYVKGDSVLGAKPGKKEEVLFSLERLNGALTAANLQTVGSLPSFLVPYESGSVLAFTSKQHRIHYDYKKNKVVADYALKNNWANYDFCPATNNLALRRETMCIFYPRMDEIRLLHVKHRMESYADRLSINGSSGLRKVCFGLLKARL